MLDDLDATIEALLRAELPQELARQVTITFEAPGSDFPAGPNVQLPAIDLFLYDVRENRDLRDNEWIVERQANGEFARRQPPLRLDCSYLVTAWPGTGQRSPARDEHRLLGEVLEALLRHPTIPEERLQGRLKDQDLPLPTTVLQAGQLQSVAELWQALGGKPRAALNYTVTICVYSGKSEQLGPPVRERVTRVSQGVQNGDDEGRRNRG